MEFDIRVFGPAARLAGTGIVTVTTTDARASTILDAIVASHPELASLRSAARLAHDHEFVEHDDLVGEGELALIVAVSGG